MSSNVSSKGIPVRRHQLILDSSKVDIPNSGTIGNYSDFYTKLDIPIEYSKEVPVNVSFISANIFYSWPIISEKNNNNTFIINSEEFGTDDSYTIPDGNYSLDEINNFIEDTIEQNYPNSVADNGGDAKIIYFNPIASISRTKLVIETLTAGFRLTFKFDNSLFSRILGFDQNTNFSYVNSPIFGLYPVDITFGITSYIILCDLVSDSYINNLKIGFLHSFSPTEPPGTLLHLEPRNLLPQKISNNFIDSIRIKVVDNNLRPVEFVEPFSLTLYISPDY